MLLAIDTATRIASLALHDGHSLRYEETWEAGREHTTQVLPRLVAAMETLRVRPEDLTAVAVALGPGSFTGLRVGLSIAKGLCMVCDIPLIGIPTLDILAAAQGSDRRPLVAVVQAGRGRICAAVYRWRGGWRRREGPFLTTWEGLIARFITPFLVCGEVDARGKDALARLEGRAEVLAPSHCLRRAGFLAELAWERLRRGETDDPATLTPLYLQHPVEG
ncbi:MAG: tRNA (adenosine(37)-N6)-threonylcarbamoyltransferase complex dimerization subunit type 1 TsaB [Anaerolineae bacterium]|nr:tRNA (adenosine(37)-N6)-threonylcarbamoyltransferase complex dimerization subunit type 1 TsaB [Anaerolineae bacterium]MCX8067830.1 tRNA (adenosine(37)-N6)-threonylcarbamoyltransferase complex dimerization subunit type 1 TsaB [Anaerolineae bacterium]MDW7990776.1 tRNA (adenosine(37)-N6)-threonylcarbamoyltransferase complex dimerization subunit type 1 TsaB [Anaerolineae bacterium]